MMDFILRVVAGTLWCGSQVLVQGTGRVMGSKDSCGTFRDSQVATLDMKERDIRRKAVPRLHGGEEGADRVSGQGLCPREAVDRNWVSRPACGHPPGTLWKL